MGYLVADELAAALGVVGLALNFDRLYAADIQGRARAYRSLTGAGPATSRPTWRRDWPAWTWTRTGRWPGGCRPARTRRRLIHRGERIGGATWPAMVSYFRYVRRLR